MRIPRDKDLQEKWQKVIQVHFNSSSCVCNRHFRPYEVFTHSRYSTLKTGVVPSIFPDISAPEKPHEKSLLIKSFSLADDNIDDIPLSHLSPIPIADIKIEEHPVIKRDPLDLDHDYEDAIPVSHLSSKPTTEKMYEETLSIKCECESDNEADDIPLDLPPKLVNPVNIKNRDMIKELKRKVSFLMKRLNARDERIRNLKVEPRENPVNIGAQKKIEELTQEMATLWRRLRNRDLKIKHLNSKIQSLKRQNAKSRQIFETDIL